MALALRPIKRASFIYPAPVPDAEGRPTQPWVHTSVVREDWGTLRAFFDGEDVTTWRNKRAYASRWSYVKPHWFGSAEAVLPQLRPYEALPSWLFEGASFDWVRELPAGLGGGLSTNPRDSWKGYVASIGEQDGHTIVNCEGLYQQADLYRRAPGLRDEALDVGTQWAFNLDPANRDALRWGTPTAPVTGKDTRYRGNWETVLEYLASIGALLPGWTWRPAADFTPELVDTLVTPGNTYTLRYARGYVDADLVRELRGSPNVIYGSGTANGVEWRRMIATAAGDPIFIPLSADSRVNTLWMDVDGNLLVDATDLDSSILRFEVYWQLPPGTTEADAVDLAEQYRLRVADPGWAGTVPLPVHFEEAHTLDARPDDVLRLKNYRGANRDLHIAEIEFEWNDGDPVGRSTVDSNARDLATLEALVGLGDRPPDFEEATNPFRRLQIGRDSAVVKDRKFQWDFGASGWLPNDEDDGRRQVDGTSTFAVTGGAWTKKKFLASEADTIARSEIVVTDDGVLGSTGRRFVAVVCANDLSLPPGGVVDPLADGAWDPGVTDLGAMYFQVGWGRFGDAMGYWPGYEFDGSPVNGHMIDETRWSYSHDSVPDDERQPAYLWLYIFTVGADAACWARFVVDKAGTP